MTASASLIRRRDMRQYRVRETLLYRIALRLGPDFWFPTDAVARFVIIAVLDTLEPCIWFLT